MVRKVPTSTDGKTYIWVQFPHDLLMMKLRNIYAEEDQSDSDDGNQSGDEETKNKDFED